MKQTVVTRTYSERDVPLKDILTQYVVEVRVFTDDPAEIILYRNARSQGHMEKMGTVNPEHYTEDQLNAINDLNDVATVDRAKIIDILCTVDEDKFNVQVPYVYKDAK